MVETANTIKQQWPKLLLADVELSLSHRARLLLPASFKSGNHGRFSSLTFHSLSPSLQAYFCLLLLALSRSDSSLRFSSLLVSSVLSPLFSWPHRFSPTGSFTLPPLLLFQSHLTKSRPLVDINCFTRPTWLSPASSRLIYTIL